jgi:hypothetical protein
LSRTSARALLLASATVLSCAVATGPATAKTSSAEKKQNTAIKKSASSIKKNTSAIKRGAKATRTADAKATTAAASAAKGIADAKAANDGVGAINTTVVPAALQALTDLKNGLLALKDGLTTAGAGLTKLATFTASDEYGIVEIGAGGTPIPGCFYETGNIPDNVQDAIVSGTCLVPNTVPALTAVNINAGIRSNESDGVAGGPAAGVAGIIAYAQTGVNTGAANAVTALGGGATVPTSLTTPPAVDIPLKSIPTSTSEPGFAFGRISSDKFVDLATSQFSGTPASPVFGDPATTPNRSVQFTIRFNDLTADAADPTA